MKNTNIVNREEEIKNKIFSIQEAAYIMRVSVVTLRRWIKDGSIKSSQPGGGKHLIKGNEILRVLECGKN